MIGGDTLLTIRFCYLVFMTLTVFLEDILVIAISEVILAVVIFEVILVNVIFDVIFVGVIFDAIFVIVSIFEVIFFR